MEGSSRGFHYGTNQKGYTKSLNQIDYLAEDEKCTYQWTFSSDGKKIPYGVSFNHGQLVYLGRVDIGGEIRIGKVGTWVPNNRLYYGYGDKELHVQNSYEVLKCIPKPKNSATTSAPTYIYATPTTTPSNTGIYD